MYSRLAAMPDQADPLQRARMLAALSVGTEIVNLRHMAPRLGVVAKLDAALKGFAQKNSTIAVARLHQLDHHIAVVRTAQANLNLAQRQVGALTAQRLSAEANLAQSKAQLRQAEVDLERTHITSPVDGYVTNLLAQLGDCVNAGTNTISLVDANSFWVDGYFEETNVGFIRVGDPAQIALMGYSQSIGGHVDSIARAINVSNAQPGTQGVATSTRSLPGCSWRSAFRSASKSTTFRLA